MSMRRNDVLPDPESVRDEAVKEPYRVMHREPHPNPEWKAQKHVQGMDLFRQAPTVSKYRPLCRYRRWRSEMVNAIRPDIDALPLRDVREDPSARLRPCVRAPLVKYQPVSASGPSNISIKSGNS